MAIDKTFGLISQLLLLPEYVETSPSCGGQGRMASGRGFPRYGFLVTNMRLSNKNEVRFYNKRGTAEQWIKEGKYALNWTRLSCQSFKANQVRLQFFSLAYNLSNFFRRLVLPRQIKHWTLTTIRDKFIKIGARMISHSRYVIFQMAEVTVSRQWMAKVLSNIQSFRLRHNVW